MRDMLYLGMSGVVVFCEELREEARRVLVLCLHDPCLVRRDPVLRTPRVTSTVHLHAEYRPSTRRVKFIYTPSTVHLHADYSPSTRQVQSIYKPSTIHPHVEYSPSTHRVQSI